MKTRLLILALSIFTLSVFSQGSDAPTLAEVTAVSTPGNDQTPSYVFSSNEAGTITSSLGFSSTTAAVSGNNTITFNTLAAGIHTPTITVTDAAGNASAALTATSFVIDVTAPTLTEVTAVSTPGNDQTPSYVFSSNEAGTITSSLGFSSTTSAVSGNNTITFSTLASGTYTPTITVTDAAGNASTALTAPSFVIDVTAPTNQDIVFASAASTSGGGMVTIVSSGDATNNVWIAAAGTTAFIVNAATMTKAATGTATSITVPTTAGTYYIYVLDAAGNASSQTTAALIVDTTLPEITLIGEAIISLEVGTAYSELGATALDNIDGDITSSIVTVGDTTVDVNTAGDYTVTYNVSDAAGNAAVEVVRTITVSSVADTTVPLITLIGEAIISLEVGTAYTDQGATALDNIDGDITSSIVTVGDTTVDVNTAGDYTVTYNVSDAAGNAAVEVVRTITVSSVADTTVPLITLIGEAIISLEVGTAYTDQGATALDNIDGDITSSIVTVGDTTVDVNTAGDYTVTYNVSDAAGNAAVEVVRTITVSSVADTTVPLITLIGEAIISLEVGTAYTDQGATALDNIDGDITSSIVTVGDTTVDVNTAGDYTVTYNVSDAAGNAAVEVVRTITVSAAVADTTLPVITLIGEAIISLEVGTAYTDQGATALDNIDGDITPSIVTVGDTTVDVNTAGDYTVTYNVSDAAGNAAVEVVRTITVSSVADTTVPLITLIGEAIISLEVGTAYTDQGATALDNIDGDITSSIVTVGDTAVDVNIAGTYVITYNVNDAVGNAALQVTRTLVVYAPDSVPPVIELLGTATISSELGTVYTDAGATALDNIDGDITASIVVNNPVDIDTEGAYTITYNVTDSATNPATQVIRVVTITGDVTAPVIALEGNSTIPLVLGSTYTDAGATALDNIDGVITADIIKVGTVDTNTAGTYTITYNVSDAAGNAAVEVVRTITVSAADTTVPVITITGPSIISLEVGTTYTDAGATAEDDIDGDITASIVLGGDTVDVNTVGVYTITYNVTDAATNAALEATRTVNIINDKIVTLAVSETTIAENESFTVSASISSAHSTDIVIDLTNVGDAKYNTDFKSDATVRITTTAGGNGYGGSANQLNEPRGVFVDNSGNLYVADTNNGRVQKFAPGATQGETLIQGLNQPLDVSVDASGNIYVVEQGTHQVSKWASDGSSLGVVAGGNGEGSNADQLWVPLGLFIDTAGNIYIADRENHRIQKWAPGATEGVTVAGGNGSGGELNQLYNPTGVTVDLQGNVYVADEAYGRIQKWAPGATQGETVIQNLRQSS